MTDRNWRLLETEDDVTEEMEAEIVDCLDWFQDVKGLNTEDFIDRFAKSYGGSGWGTDDWDIGAYDNAAVKKIMRIARKAKREQDQ